MTRVRGAVRQPGRGRGHRRPADRRPRAHPSGFEVVVKGGREPAGLDAIDWAVRAVELGAGELLVTSIDRDGTKSGFDIALLRAISDRVHGAGHRVGRRGRARGLRRGRARGWRGRRAGGGHLPSARGLDREVKAAMAAAGLPVRLLRSGAAA